MTAELRAPAVTVCLSCRRPSSRPVCAACADPRPTEVVTPGQAMFRAVRLSLIGGAVSALCYAVGGGALPVLTWAPAAVATLLGLGHFAHRDTGGISLDQLERAGEPCDRLSRIGRPGHPLVARCVGIGWALKGQSLIPVGDELVCAPCAVALGVNDQEVTA